MSKKEAEEKKEENTKEEENEELLSTVNTSSVIKKGDYNIHVLIEQIKDCVGPKKDFLPSPVIKLKCFGQTQRTSKLDTDTQNNIFNEHFYFDKTDLTVIQLAKEKILIEVYDNHNTSRKDYLGIYEFDLEHIYNKSRHTLKSTWIALANPEAEDITKINGYLKLSISVLHDNDERVELKPSEINDSGDCIIPSQIKIKSKQLVINFFKGEELPDDSDNTKDVNRSCQAFIYTKYFSNELTTSVVEMDNKRVVVWNEAIKLGITIPSVGKKIDFQLRDEDLIGINKLGSFSLTYKDILDGKYSDYTYVNVYGASGNKKNEYYEEMNTNPSLGSMWKGRILIKIDIKESDMPVNKVEKITDQDLIKNSLVNRNETWTLYSKVYEAVYLPDSKNEYKIRVSFEEAKAGIKYQKAFYRKISLYEGGKIHCLSNTTNPDRLPDIIIALVNKKNNVVSFQRLKASLFYMKNRYMVVKLIPEPSVGIIQNTSVCGLVKIRLFLINSNRDTVPKEINLKEFESGNPQKTGNIDKEIDDLFEENEEDDNKKDLSAVGLIGRVDSQAFKTEYIIAVNVYMSRHLVSADSNGTNDPYVEVYLDDKKEVTKQKPNCINGIWNTTLLFHSIAFDINDKTSWPVLYIKVMDKDLIEDDEICYNYIWLSDMAYSINDTTLIKKPKWHQMLLSKSDRPQGELLLSCNIIDKEHMKQMPNISPEIENYTFELNVLGLRNLKPLSLIPIKKAFVTFDLNSLNFGNNSENEIEPVKTEPKDSGNNPNITSMIKFNAYLPKDPDFIPYLQCEVNDYILGGIINQHLGMFELNIKDIIQDTKKGIQNDLDILKQNDEIIIKKDNQCNINKKMQSFSKDLFLDSKNNLNQPLIDGKKEEEKIEDNVDICYDYFIKEKSDLEKYNFKKIPEKEIRDNLYNSEYFVLRPVFVEYEVPGMANKNGEKKYHSYYIEDKNEAPDDVLYFPIGFAKYIHHSDMDNNALNKGYNSKHYRRIFKTELENVPELGISSPFITCNINREKFVDEREQKAMFHENMQEDNIYGKILKFYGNDGEEAVFNDNLIADDNNNLISSTSKYGIFKTFASIYPTKDYKAYLNEIDTLKKKDPKTLEKLPFYKKNEKISKILLKKCDVIIHVYVLRLNGLNKKDAFSDSDPYITINLGNKEVINDKKNRQDNKVSCDWYKLYEIATELPGSSTMEIKVHDYDPIFSDELIGSTCIDIEDRYFNSNYMSLKNKPIEIRKLYNPDFTNSQGEIIMWLDIFEKQDKLYLDPWDITPCSVEEVQVRFIIYSAEDVEMMDVEGTSDVYVLAYLDNDKSQSTDVHYRCQTGLANFNWRMLFDIEMPRNKKEMNVLVYDNDFLSRDDFICGTVFNISKLLDDCYTLDMPIKYNKKYYKGLDNVDKDKNVDFDSVEDNVGGDKFYLKMKKNGEERNEKVLCSLEVMPKWYSDVCPVGKGRDEPNINPHLPPPLGRIQFSWNPITMFNQLIGPAFRKKFYTGCILICHVIYCIIIIPFIVYYLGGELANPFNYIKRKK